jgi:hypothetical protein
MNGGADDIRSPMNLLQQHHHIACNPEMQKCTDAKVESNFCEFYPNIEIVLAVFDAIASPNE